MLSVAESKLLNIMAKLQNIAKRLERYGAVPLSVYRNNPANVHDHDSWNDYVLQLVYDDNPVDEDGEDYILYERVTHDMAVEYKDMRVRYCKPFDVEEYFVHVDVPVINGQHCSFVIGHDGLIEPMDIDVYASVIKEENEDDSE